MSQPSIGRTSLWGLAERLAQQASSFAVFIVLARLTGPAAYGAFAVGFAPVQILQALIMVGVTDALFRPSDQFKSEASALLWITSALGLAGMLGIIGCAIAMHQTSDLVTSITIVTAPLLVLVASALVPTAVIQIRQDFRALARRTFFAGCLASLVSIPCALLGWGAWAFVVHQWAQQLAATIIAFASARFKPDLSARSIQVRRVLVPSLSYLPASLAAASEQYGPRLLINANLGVGAAGALAAAQRIYMLLFETFGATFGQVMLSRWHKDASPWSSFQQLLWVSAALFLPISVGLWLTGPELVLLALGADWTGAAVILRAFALWLPFAGLSSLLQAALRAQGRTSVFRLPALLRAAAILLLFGSLAKPEVAQTVQVAAFVYGLYAFGIWGYVRRHAVLSDLAMLTGPAIATVAMAAAVGVAQPTLTRAPPLAGLSIALLVGVTAYTAALLGIDRRRIAALRDDILGQ